MWWLVLSALAKPRPITIPIDVGIGPSAHLVTGPVFRDQPVHTGLSLSLEAIIDQKTLRKYRRRIPARYREMAMRMDEVRYAPFIWLPETVFVSPAVRGTGMYGATWRPVSLGIPWVKDPFRFVTSVAPRVTYAFLHSRTLPSPTHFLRPGIDVRAEAEIPFSDDVLLSLGWTSQLYPPQEVGGSMLRWGTLDESIWHIGQATLQLHVRVPYKTTF
ncbi:MAG: hypothetical protein R3F61_10385 [Myxococcota bacterium]